MCTHHSHRSRFNHGVMVTVLVLLGFWVRPVPAQEAAPAETPAPAAPVTIVEIVPGVGGEDVDGNARRYHQYITLADGLRLANVSLIVLPTADSETLLLTANDPGTSAAKLRLWGAGQYGAIVLRGQSRTSDFYRDWTPAGTLLARDDHAYDLTVFPTASLLRVTYDAVSLHGQDPNEAWTRHAPGFDAATSINGWAAGLGVQRDALDVSRGTAFDGSNLSYGLTLAPPGSSHGSMVANAVLTKSTLDALSREPQSFRVSLEGIREISPDIILTGHLYQEHLDDYITQNALAIHDSGAQVQAEYRGWRRATVLVGGGARFVDCLNDTQTAHVNAVNNQVFARVTVRATPRLKFTGRTALDWTNNPPVNSDPFTGTQGTNLWTSRQDHRFGFNYAPTVRTGVTGTLRLQCRQNDEYDTRSALMTGDLFAWWMPHDRYTVYATYLAQNATLEIPGYTDNSTTDARTLVGGVTYQYSPALALDASLTRTKATGASPSTEHIFSLGAYYTARSGHRWALTWALDDFTNTLDHTTDYTANRAELSYAMPAF